MLRHVTTWYRFGMISVYSVYYMGDLSLLTVTEWWHVSFVIRKSRVHSIWNNEYRMYILSCRTLFLIWNHFEEMLSLLVLVLIRGVRDITDHSHTEANVTWFYRGRDDMIGHLRSCENEPRFVFRSIWRKITNRADEYMLLTISVHATFNYTPPNVADLNSQHQHQLILLRSVITEFFADTTYRIEIWKMICLYTFGQLRRSLGTFSFVYSSSSSNLRYSCFTCLKTDRPVWKIVCYCYNH